MSGVLLAAAEGGQHLAWVGVEVAAATDLTRLSGYAELPERERVAQAHQADSAYLERLSRLPHGTVLDYRWVGGTGTPGSAAGAGGPGAAGGGGAPGAAGGGAPGAAGGGGPGAAGGPRLAVLARVAAASAEAAREAALAVREQVGRLPEHVQGAAVTDADALHDWLWPAELGWVADVRRRPATGQPRRPDAHTGRYVLVRPCGWHPERWEPLLGALARHPGRVLLSVGLQPFDVPPQLVELLRYEAAQYARLAREVTLAGAGLAGRTTLAGEPFAQQAAPLYAQAALRYTGTAFRLRVTLAADRPLAPDLVHALLDALATDQLDGPEDIEATPQHGRDHAGATWLLRGLGVPAACADQVLLLATLADAQEAAAYCPLPAAAGGHSALPVRDPAPERLAGGLRVLGDYVAGDKHGGDNLFGGDKHVYGAR